MSDAALDRVGGRTRAVSGVTYDSGTPIAGDRGSRELWLPLERGVRPTFPRSRRRGRGATAAARRSSHGLLRGCRGPPFADRDVRAVGGLLAASRANDVVGAAVVLTACARDEAIVTSDLRGLRVVAGALGRAPTLHAI